MVEARIVFLPLWISSMSSNIFYQHQVQCGSKTFHKCATIWLIIMPYYACARHWCFNIDIIVFSAHENILLSSISSLCRYFWRRYIISICSHKMQQRASRLCIDDSGSVMMIFVTCLSESWHFIIFQMPSPKYSIHLSQFVFPFSSVVARIKPIHYFRRLVDISLQAERESASFRRQMYFSQSRIILFHKALFWRFDWKPTPSD